jgi:hypothetical protein
LQTREAGEAGSHTLACPLKHASTEHIALFASLFCDRLCFLKVLDVPNEHQPNVLRQGANFGVCQTLELVSQVVVDSQLNDRF